MEKVGLSGKLKLELRDKCSGVVLDSIEASNFITESYRRFILDNTYSFITGNSVAVTKPSYCTRNGADKSLKFALAVTDNKKVYNESDKKKLGDVEGNVVSITTGVKSVGASDESFIEYIDFLEGGGIEIKAVIRAGEGEVSAVNLVIPSDFAHNDDGGGVYKGIIGEQLVGSINNKSGDYMNTVFVKKDNKVYWGFVCYSPNTKYIINSYDIVTKEWKYIEETATKSTFQVSLQFIGEELYVMQNVDNIKVYDVDLKYIRTETTKNTLSVNTSNSNAPEGTIYFIHEGVLYVLDYLYSSSSNKYFKVGRTALSSSDKVDYTAMKTIKATDLDDIKRILYGDRLEGTTYIRSLDGKVYDVMQLFEISDIADWSVVDDADCSMYEGRPIGLYRGIKIDDYRWMGVYHKSSDFNKICGLSTSSALNGGKHFCDNITYSDYSRYVTIVCGGNALTHASLGQTITKTEDNEIVITYTIK